MNKKICFIVTVSMTVDQFLRFSFQKFNENGYDIYVIADMTSEYIETLPKYVKALPIEMNRGIDFFGALQAVREMVKIFRREKFDLVQYSTPNASFYAALASSYCRVPVRLYCQWGLVFQSFTGIKKEIFKLIERIVCALSTDVQPDSHGNLELCRKNKFYNEKKSRVVWNGSANGVNFSKFQIANREMYSFQIRKQYGIDEKAVVLGFVGRVGKEKGFEELMEMFRLLLKEFPQLILLYVGPNEKPDTVDERFLDFFEKCPNIKYTGGWVDDTEKYYAAMDIFVFPTYHEGFGSVTIEAEAMGVPVVVSDVPGPQDAMVDGVTGYKVPSHSVSALVEKCSILIRDESLRIRMGKNSRKFVEEKFDESILLNKIIENRNWLLKREANNSDVFKA